MVKRKQQQQLMTKKEFLAHFLNCCAVLQQPKVAQFLNVPLPASPLAAHCGPQITTVGPFQNVPLGLLFVWEAHNVCVCVCVWETAAAAVGQTVALQLLENVNG